MRSGGVGGCHRTLVVVLAIVMLAAFGSMTAQSRSALADDDSALPSPSPTQSPVSDTDSGAVSDASTIQPGDLVDSTAESNTYATAGTGERVVIYPESVNYRDPDSGTWEPIDNTLVPSEDSSGTFENQANSYNVLFPATLENPIRFETTAGWVTFQLEDAGGTASVDEATATYSEALPGVDATYTAANESVRELLILSSSSETGPFNFTVDLSSGLSPMTNPEGGIDFLTPGGTTAFSFAPPYMLDSSGTEEGYSTDVSMELSASEGLYTLTVTPDISWISDASREWPIIIDPTINMDAQNNCFIISGSLANGNNCGLGYVKAGVASDGNTRRALLKFNIGATGIASSAVVSSATLRLYLYDATSSASASYQVRRVTTNWTTAVTWNKYDGTHTWGTSGGDLGSTVWDTITLTGTPAGFKDWAVGQLAQSWVDGTNPNYGLVLKQASETVTNNLTFYGINGQGNPPPKLVLTYNTPPQTPTTLSTDVTDYSPIFHARFVDPDSDTGQIEYTIKDSAGAVVAIQLAGAVSSNTDDPLVADETYELEAGDQYTWTARGYDGALYSSATAPMSFVYWPSDSHDLGTLAPDPGWASPTILGDHNFAADPDSATPTSYAVDPVLPDPGEFGPGETTQATAAESAASAAVQTTTYTLQTRTSTGCQAIACHNLGQGGYPPDAGIASDGVWRVVVNNAGVYVFDSSATRKHFFTWCAFFIGHPEFNCQPSPVDFTDPDVVYDKWHKRFIMSVLGINTPRTDESTADFFYAVSFWPTGATSWDGDSWSRAFLDPDNNTNAVGEDAGVHTDYFADQPILGVNGQGFYITADMFRDASETGNEFIYSSIWAFPAPGYGSYKKWNDPLDAPGETYRLRPAVTLSNPGIEYLVYQFHKNSLGLFWFVWDRSTNPITPRLHGVKQIGILGFDPDPINPSQANLGSRHLDISSVNRVSRPSYQAGHLWTAHAVAKSTGDCCTVELFNILTKEWDSTLSQNREYRFNVTNHYLILPTVGTDYNHDHTLLFLFGAGNEAVSAGFVQAISGPDSWGTTIKNFAAGSGPIDDGDASDQERIGDYLSVAPDKNAPGVLWMLGEYGDGSFGSQMWGKA